MNKLKEFQDRLLEEFQTLPGRYGYIVYVFDNGPDGQGTGFSHNADPGDALVAIERIKGIFGIK